MKHSIYIVVAWSLIAVAWSLIITASCEDKHHTPNLVDHHNHYAVKRGHIARSFIVTASCEDKHHTPNLIDHHNRYTVKQGHIYRFEYEEEIDQQPMGYAWYGDNLANSPLAWMHRIPIIVKADDYGGPINSSSARFIETVDAFDGMVSLGIITSKLTDRNEVNQTYYHLHQQGFEAWFHGHSHYLSDNKCEFRNTSQQDQEASFRTGIERGCDMLGVEFHTFGAPGNGIDDATSKALVSFPQILVWLFGDTQAPALVSSDVTVLKRYLDIEQQVGRIKPKEKFLEALDEVLNGDGLDVLTLQVHPIGYDEIDFHQAEDIFEALSQWDIFRYTSPYALWKWEHDKGNMVLTKTSSVGYTLDLSAALYDHIIEFDPDSRVSMIENEDND